MFPSSYTFTAQDPSLDITIPEQALRCDSKFRSFYYRSQNQRTETATSKDIANIARLINELPGFNVFSISVLADDAPRW